MSRWFAFARVYVGLVWFAYGASKFEPNWAAPNGEFLSAVKDAVSKTSGPMHDFVVSVVIPNQHVFALLIAYGETLVGISLILGLLTKAGAVGGMFLSLNYYLATGQYRFLFGIESLELMLFVFCLLLLVFPSDAVLSVDSLLRRARAQRSRGAAQSASGADGH
jgi:thiosulfate dehydrogenase [quinone] large subunit